LNGLIVEFLETIPEPGTTLKMADYMLEVLQTSDNAIKRSGSGRLSQRRPELVGRGRTLEATGEQLPRGFLPSRTSARAGDIRVPMALADVDRPSVNGLGGEAASRQLLPRLPGRCLSPRPCAPIDFTLPRY